MPKKWSTKTQTVLRSPTRERCGLAEFEFTDDYSVFHYSKMPDQIPGKGEALSRMAAFSFSKLIEAGIKTHFVKYDGDKTFTVRLVRLLYPQNGEISAGEKNFLVPLQVICRNVLPEGASLFRRLDEGKVTLEQVGLTERPKPGQVLQKPIIEFTTKLEEIDRFLTESQAQELSVLSDEQWKELKRITLAVNDIVSERALEIGLTHADMKIEFGVNEDGELMVVDTAGTQDENRFLLEGVHMTKQVLRDYYLVRGLEKQVQDWAADGVPRSEWSKPDALPAELLSFASDMYKSLSDSWTGKKTFHAPSLPDLRARLIEQQSRW